MKKYKTEMIKHETLDTIQCDCCKKEFGSDDFLEIQEFHHISFTGGYGSIFGDGEVQECDLCQHCLKELLGKYIRQVGHFWPGESEMEKYEDEDNSANSANSKV